ncbi:MAG: hypothetical protein WEC84_03800 [Candidatus Andersenbacteria bacterium]
MAQSFERTPQERETLIFSNPDQAQEFAEKATEKIATPKGSRSRKEIIGQQLAQEFERSGEAVGSIVTHPWEHTQQEHEEVQQLVNIAFEKDLPTALKAARSSKGYPRNIDLLHDVLTTEMYDLVRDSHLNRQPTGLAWITVVGLVLLVGVITTLVLFFT